MQSKQESLNQDILLKKIKEMASSQKTEASRHKYIHRFSWAASALISISIAMFSTFDWSIYSIESRSIATFLALILPLVTSYVVLRTPQKLWVFEVNTRNQLYNLATEIEFLIDREAEYDREPYEKKYLKIMTDANIKWIELKEKNN